MRTAWLREAIHRAHLADAMIKLISWNLLRLTGASLDDIVRLVRREQPDLLLIHVDYVVRATNSFYNRVYPFFLLESRP